MNLTEHTNAQLVDVYNGLGPDTPLKNWKQSKDKLIGRIQDLQTKQAPKLESKEKARTVRAAAIEHLCFVDHFEDSTSKDGETVDDDHSNARSVGLPYNKIIELILGEFPEAKTSVACLRWYSVKIRVEETGYEGLRLPQRRPRAKSKKE